MLKVKNLTKYYGDFKANDNIAFELEAGTLALLVGPNGAGKTTLLRSLAGLLRFEGEVLINGIPAKSVEAKQYLGYVPEIPAVYPLLTVYEHMEFVAGAYKLQNWQAKSDALLERMQLSEKRDQPAAGLSKGMKQKLSICTAVLPDPPFMIFDEPLIGLDPHAIKEIKVLIRELADSGHTLLVSTHILDTVDEIWDRCMIMGEGRILADVSRDELRKNEISLEDYFFEISEGKEPPAES